MVIPRSIKYLKICYDSTRDHFRTDIIKKMPIRIPSTVVNVFITHYIKDNVEIVDEQEYYAKSKEEFDSKFGSSLRN